MTFWQEAWLRRQETCGAVGPSTSWCADCPRERVLLLERLKRYFFSSCHKRWENGSFFTCKSQKAVSGSLKWSNWFFSLNFAMTGISGPQEQWGHSSSMPLWSQEEVKDVPGSRLHLLSRDWLFSAWSRLAFLCPQPSGAGPSLCSADWHQRSPPALCVERGQRRWETGAP